METMVSRRFAKYVSLSVLSMIGLSCYILADTFFISNKVGAIGLAALNFAIPTYSALNGTGLMLGVGGATKFAIHRARGETEEGNRAFTHVIVFGAMLSALFMAVGWFAADPLAAFLGADEEAHALTSMYITVLLTFSPCFTFNNILVAFSRNDNAPRLAMAAMLTGSFINVVLDYVFVYPLDMGMFGAALATGISPTVSLLLVISMHNLRGKSTFHLRRCRLRPSLVGKCCALGVSAFIGEVSSCVVILVFNLIVFRLSGNFGVAAYGIIANTAYVVISIFNGVTQGSQPLLSDYYALGEKAAEKKTLRLSIITAVALGGLVWLGVTIFAPQITAVFNSEGNEMVAAVAISGLRIYFVGFWLTGVNLMIAAYFAAVECTRASFAVSISRALIGIVILVVILSQLWGLTGVWMSFPAAELVTVVVAIFLYVRMKMQRGRNTYRT